MTASYHALSNFLSYDHAANQRDLNSQLGAPKAFSKPFKNHRELLQSAYINFFTHYLPIHLVANLESFIALYTELAK